MKNLIPKKWVLLVTFFFIFLSNTFATNYVVSGAGDTNCNGTYVEAPDWVNGKPYYVYINGGSTYAIGWNRFDLQWQLGMEMIPGMIMGSYSNISTSSECPTTGWETLMGMGIPPVPTVEMDGRALSYSSVLFTENVANDGSIANTIVITYNGYGGDAFTGSLTDNFVTGSKVTVSNVPAGLTASMIKTAANQLTFSLTGNTTNHEQTDKIGNISVIFNDAAFVQGNASGVSNYNKSNIAILYKITFSGGAGTVADPYLVSNKVDLRILSENWSGVLWDKHYKQNADISFQATDFQTGGDFYNSGEGWITIGNNTTTFTGTYNGDGHTIFNLFINRAQNYQGLFGRIEGTIAKVEKLGVINVNVTGNYAVGGLVGFNNQGNISNCYSTGNINNNGQNTGGLVGYNYHGSISNSYSTCMVSSIGVVGGLVGLNDNGSISSSYSTGNVIGAFETGGLVGYNVGSVSNCYSTGNVTRSSSETDTKFGGFVGWHSQGTITNSYSTGWVKYMGVANPTDKGFAGYVGTGTFSSCFWDTQTSAQATSAGTATGKTTDQMKTQATFTDWDFATVPVWKIDAAKNSGYPYLNWQIYESTYTWNGLSSSVWNVNGNWSSNTVPTATDNVIIPNVANDPIIGAASVSTEACKNLTIESGAVLTISAGKSLTVNGNLVNSAGTTGLVIKSEATSTGSLKILGGVSASATVERYMLENKWHVVSAPATENINTFLNRNLVIPNLVGGDYNGKLGMMDYNTTGNNWNLYFTGGSNGTGDLFGVGKGYMVRTAVTVLSPAPTIIDFQGTLNAGIVDVTINRTGLNGWNCIGNPYTSAIKIADGVGGIGTDNFIDINYNTLDDIFTGVYLFNGTSYDIVNYTSASVTELYASLGQGFFVRAKNDNTKVSFSTAMQFHNPVAFKSATTIVPSIKLVATNSSSTVSTEIKFVGGTTNGLDKGYDAGILKADPSFAIYTKLVEPFDAEFQLQCLPPSGYDKMVIPIGIDSKSAGEIVFTVQTVQLAQDCKVILEDKLTNTFTDLSKGSYKAAIVADTKGAERFFLHTGDIISGLEDQSLPEGKLTAYVKGNNEIRVIGEVGDGAIATLFNGLGQVVLTKTLGAGNLNIIGLPSLTSGLYLLNINDKGTAQTIKVMIRK